MLGCFTSLEKVLRYLGRIMATPLVWSEATLQYMVRLRGESS